MHKRMLTCILVIGIGLMLTASYISTLYYFKGV